MKKSTLIYIGITILVELLFISEGITKENFSGKWYVYAGNTRYIMNLTQRGHEIFGNMRATNRNNSLPVSVYGSVNERMISINAYNRNFTIIFQFKGAMIGMGSGRGVCGSMTINNRHNHKWHAVRYD